MPDLSVLIPARNEQFLKNTVEDCLAHAKGDTEIIVVLDGAWADPPLEKHERVQVIYLPESIGQRAATNLAARVSKAKYIMKLDAHCSMGDGFDVKLIEAAKELERETIQIPAQKNLHVFDWMCDGCGTRTYQGPTPTMCLTCAAKGTTGGPFHREMVWKARSGTLTTAWRFDHTLHFAYHGEFKHRPEGKPEISETMSCLGACWFLDREWYFDLGGLDELYGSWGAMGTELSCKAWLSGGRMVCTKRTEFIHCFRTQGSDWSFPWPCSGAQVERARQRSRDIWFNNAYEKQVRPLSWLIDRFMPLPDWGAPHGADALAMVRAAGAQFTAVREKRGALLDGHIGAVGSPGSIHVGSLVDSHAGASSSPPLGLAYITDAAGVSVGEIPRGPEKVSSDAMGLGPVDGRDRGGPGEVLQLHDQGEMGGITAPLVVAHDVVKDGDASPEPHGQWLDKPSVDQSMDAERLVVSDLAAQPDETGLTVAILVQPSDPVPASGRGVDGDAAEEFREGDAVEMRDREKMVYSQLSALSDTRSEAETSTTLGSASLFILSERWPIATNAGAIFYSDCRPDPFILESCRSQIAHVFRHRPVVSCTLKPVNLGLNVVYPAERGVLTMARQILIALKLLDAEVVYFLEQDCVYHPSHFQCHPESGVFTYDQNFWKLNSATGDALFYFCNQLSGLCVTRTTAIAHYEKRVAKIEREGFTRNIGHEPGTRKIRHGGIDDSQYASWMAEFPSVDIRHDKNLTPNRWEKALFRNKKHTDGWTEASEIPGWGLTKGRFPEWLREVTTHEE